MIPRKFFLGQVLQHRPNRVKLKRNKYNEPMNRFFMACYRCHSRYLCMKTTKQLKDPIFISNHHFVPIMYILWAQIHSHCPKILCIHEYLAKWWQAINMPVMAVLAMYWLTITGPVGNPVMASQYWAVWAALYRYASNGPLLIRWAKVLHTGTCWCHVVHHGTFQHIAAHHSTELHKTSFPI